MPILINLQTIAKIQGRIFGRFNTSDRRITLFEKFRGYHKRLSEENLLDHIIVNGSFVTDKAAPSDIDLILALKANVEPDQNWNPNRLNLVTNRWVRKSYGFDILLAKVDSQLYNDYLSFFTQVKENPDLKKGVIRLEL